MCLLRAVVGRRARKNELVLRGEVLASQSPPGCLFPDSLGLNSNSLLIVSAMDGNNLPHHLPDMVLVY